jgi:enterochelin esterase-like enzyme
MTLRIAAGLVLALLSAGALNWSYFVQHGAASGLPPLTVRKPLRSLGTLFGNRRWVLGFFTGIGGWALYVAALALAPLSLVQASSAGGLGVLAALTGVRTRRERLAVGTAIAGLGLLGLSLAGGNETAGHVSLAGAAVWMAASAGFAALAAGPAANVFARGAGLGSAAGILYAAGDVGTKAAVSGGFHVAFVPALLACHGLAFVALQLGFQRGSALTTAGLATLWTNALPIAAGMTVFGEPLPGGLLGVARITAFATVVVGAALLTRPADEPGGVAEASGVRASGVKIAGGVVAALTALICVTAAFGAPSSSHDTSPIAGFTLIDQGSSGGTVWSGRVPNPFVPTDVRLTDVYLPPHYSPGQRYPVLYLLHGFWGAPSSFVVSLKLADVADSLIQKGAARPFIAVMPPGGRPAGTKKQRAMSEWAGVWENFVVRTVVPWTDSHLSTEPRPAGRTIAGVSAGGYGSVDIAVRHLGVFSKAESWEGYFTPFRDGPFVHASAATLAAHDPTLLVREHAAAIRARALHFFLSTGGSHGAVKRSWTLQFARELEELHIPARLWMQPLGEKGFGRHQLPAALTWAAPAPH